LYLIKQGVHLHGAVRQR